jgi:WD40 repeat protein/serine/threonine protein kinase
MISIKLLQQIGEGGMGIVYMAEQQEPVRRKIALKIIKPGMDSKQVIARFEAERQALALMDHQNIAKVFDAGTTPGVRGQESGVREHGSEGGSLTPDSCLLTPGSGRPYFVMELVHGVPLTKYCDDHQLTPSQRLELFLPVCHAVQHAHQKGIIHRDLKPSNILVTMYDDKPVPKVIDFGVAKAVEQRLTEKTLFTQFGTLVGTLEYMSPQQAEPNAFGVDTRSDIYSLGVLLYELLTGTTPLERARLREAAYGDIVRLIKEEEPPRPSTRLSTSGAALAGISQQRGSAPGQLTELVRGELDWIVMRCLEKDRTRRYETANGLARDVDRYLHDEPVEACPPTAGYKLRKFARKNQKLLATAAAFGALLLLGVAASAWQAVRATQAETVALVHEQQANANAAQAQEKEQEANQQRDEAQCQRDEIRVLNDRLQRTLYAAHMNLAHNAWEAGGPERVRELLEQHRPKAGETDLRGFEWYYLYRVCHAELLTLEGHTGSVQSMAYSPDGKRLAGGGRVWDTQTSQVLFSMPGRIGYVYNVAFSPDGKRLVSGSDDRTVRVWDAQTGQELLSLKGGGVGVAYSPDSKRLASALDDGTVKLWDAQTGQELLTIKGHSDRVRSVAFSPDGKRLASSSRDETVKVWDAQTGQELLSLKGGGGVAYSPDGKRLASGEKVWDAQTGQELLSLKGARRLVFSPDGKRLASPSLENTVKVWDAQTEQELLTFKGHTEMVSSVVFSPDGRQLASASWDHTVKVWDAQTMQRPLLLKGGAASVACVAFSSDGKRLATGRGGYDEQRKPVPAEVRLWNAQTGQELLTLKGLPGRVTCMVFSPDGKRLASGTGQRSRPPVPGQLKVWDAQTGQDLLTLKHAGGVFGVAYSPDGKRLASASNDQRVRVWDAQSGQELLSLKGNSESPHFLGVHSVAFSPDGKRLASASQDGTVKVWDAQTGQELQGYGGMGTAGGAPGPMGLVFSPDSKRLASAVQGKAVKVWDTQTGQETLTLKGHTDTLKSIAFSPDSKRLASTSRDRTVKVWDAQTGQELLSFKGDSEPVGSVAFSPDGQRLISAWQDSTVKTWDATPLPEKP